MTRPQVIILTSVHPALDTRIFHLQARTLARAGYAVTIVGNHPRAETLDGIVIEPIRASGSRLARMLIAPLRLAWTAFRSGVGICHLHDPELVPVGLILTLFGRQVIYDVHEDYPQQALSKHYLPPFLRRAAACLAAALERAAGAAFATVVAATDTIAARFPGPKTVVIRNYPAPPSAHGLRLTANGQSPESEGCRPSAVSCTPFGRFRLVHLAGTLTHVRGITSMVRAMDFLDDSFELVLAGRFEPAEYGAVLGRLPGYARVRHIRNVPHPDVWSLYRRCHVGLVCSLPLTRHLFALPVKLFEFMAAGLPVVVSDFPLLRAIVEENDCGIPVNPEDPGAIAAAVRRLARDPALARRLGENGIRAVATTFNWEREAAVLLRSYARLGARLPAPGSPRMTCRSTSSTASIPHSALPR